MKRLAKKSLSVLIALTMAFVLFVPAFAADPDSDSIIHFSADINYENNQLDSFFFVVEGYVLPEDATFACSIYDSQNNEVFNETMVGFDFMVPEGEESEEELYYILVEAYVFDLVILNPDETYALVVAAGSFETADGEPSPELTYSFLASDYIYVPTIWDHILWFLHSNPILEFIFARVITFIEFFYYNPLPIFPFPVG